jgi:uncharacterized LabA/DUF88 family protein
MLNMNLYRDQRVCVLVDVQNLYYSGKNLYNAKVNFDEIMKTALRGRKLVRAICYAIKADMKDEGNFHEALEKIGFEVKTKDLLIFHGGHKKGDWDVGIAMDAVRAAEKADTIVVVSGDGDFKELYEYVRGKGCRVEVIAFGRTASSSVKEYVDLFIDIDKDKKYLIPLKGYRPMMNNNNNNPKHQHRTDGKPNVHHHLHNAVPNIADINAQQPTSETTNVNLSPKVNNDKGSFVKPVESRDKNANPEVQQPKPAEPEEKQTFLRKMMKKVRKKE